MLKNVIQQTSAAILKTAGGEKCAALITLKNVEQFQIKNTGRLTQTIECITLQD